MDDRPLSICGLLGKTFSLYRHNFRLFVGASIIGPTAATTFRFLYRSVRSATASPLSMVLAVMITVTIMLLGLAISSAATVNAAAGRDTNLRDAYQTLTRSILRVIGIALSALIRAFTVGVLFLLLGAVALGLAAALGYNSRVEAGLIGYVCGGIALASAILASIGIYARHAVAIPACVVEGLSVKSALRRSTLLTEGARFRVVVIYGVCLSLYAVFCALLVAATLLFRAHGIAFLVADALAALLSGALTAPIGTIGLSLVYYSECLRKEAQAGGSFKPRCWA